MKALLIEFNLMTGKRAGNVDPSDPALQCYGWQRIDTKPALEIRLIEDNRSVKNFKGVKGITVLKTNEEIDNKIDELFEGKYVIKNQEIFDHDIKKSGLRLESTFEELDAKRIRGIARQEPLHIEDLV